MTTTHHRTRRPIFSDLRDDLRTRRAAQARRRDLERQLAAYQAPNDIHDLLRLISREDTAEAEEIRKVLDDNLASWARRAA